MLAPVDFSFVNITGSSVGVKLEEPKENNVIKRYEAYVEGGRPDQACLIKANEDPLVCEINTWNRINTESNTGNERPPLHVT